MAEIIRPKDWGFGEMMDTEEIEEAEKDYQYILNDHIKNLLADTMKRAKEKDNN